MDITIFDYSKRTYKKGSTLIVPTQLSMIKEPYWILSVSTRPLEFQEKFPKIETIYCDEASKIPFVVADYISTNKTKVSRYCDAEIEPIELLRSLGYRVQDLGDNNYRCLYNPETIKNSEGKNFIVRESFIVEIQSSIRIPRCYKFANELEKLKNSLIIREKLSFLLEDWYDRKGNFSRV